MEHIIYEPTAVYQGDARDIQAHIEPGTIALSVWSPPYHVGKDYERDMSFVEWKHLLRRAIEGHIHVLKPGGFLAINIADILVFRDPDMPRVMAENVSHRKRGDITREKVIETMSAFPNASRYEIAEILQCSEQTIDRRLKGNNIRGGKYQSQTRVKLVGGLIEQFADLARGKRTPYGALRRYGRSSADGAFTEEGIHVRIQA